MSDKIEGDSWPANAKWIHSPNQTGWNFLLLELDTLPECLVCRTDGYGTIRSYLGTLRWYLVCRTVRYQSALRKAKCKLTSRIKLFSRKPLDDSARTHAPRVSVDQTKHIGYELCVTQLGKDPMFYVVYTYDGISWNFVLCCWLRGRRFNDCHGRL